MQMTILGSAGWMPSLGRETACYAVREGDRLLLLDCGTGAHRLVTEPALVDGVATLDIFISHFHLDHIVGLTYLSALSRSLNIVVHAPGAWLYGTPSSAIIDDLIRTPYQPTTLRESGVAIHDLTKSGLSWGSHQIQVRHQSTHTAASVAYRLDSSLVYCTDTAYDTGNAEFATDCSVLLHEAWYLAELGAPGHSSALEAAAIASRAGVGRLVLVHLPPDEDANALCAAARSVFPRTTVAADRLALELECERS